MRLVEGLASVHEPVLSVGVFDGVHRGHRQLLYELRVWAQSADGTPCVLTFQQHPLSVLQGIAVPEILPLEQRLVELERHGVEACVVADFEAIKDLTAAEFLERIAKEGCRKLLLGFDTHLGKDRDGTPATLPGLGARLGLEVRTASRVLDKDGHKIGSHAIRQAILHGELERAANLLGRPVCLRGTVVLGEGRGEALGAATANLDLGGQVMPPDGVYIVRVFHDAATAPALANLGVRPTFGGGRRTLEVHVPGWSGALYGEVLEVRFLRKLRNEHKFESPDALRRQIEKDKEALARAVARGEL